MGEIVQDLMSGTGWIVLAVSIPTFWFFCTSVVRYTRHTSSRMRQLELEIQRREMEKSRNKGMVEGLNENY